MSHRNSILFKMKPHLHLLNKNQHQWHTLREIAQTKILLLTLYLLWPPNVCKGLNQKSGFFNKVLRRLYIESEILIKNCENVKALVSLVKSLLRKLQNVIWVVLFIFSWSRKQACQQFWKEFNKLFKTPSNQMVEALT